MSGSTGELSTRLDSLLQDLKYSPGSLYAQKDAVQRSLPVSVEDIAIAVRNELADFVPALLAPLLEKLNSIHSDLRFRQASEISGPPTESSANTTLGNGTGKSDYYVQVDTAMRNTRPSDAKSALFEDAKHDTCNDVSPSRTDLKESSAASPFTVNPLKESIDAAQALVEFLRRDPTAREDSPSKSSRSNCLSSPLVDERGIVSAQLAARSEYAHMVAAQTAFENNSGINKSQCSVGVQTVTWRVPLRALQNFRFDKSDSTEASASLRLDANRKIISIDSFAEHVPACFCSASEDPSRPRNRESWENEHEYDKENAEMGRFA